MGETSFRYGCERRPKYEMPFKYRHTLTTEYAFAYMRLAASHDTRYFNNPVAISKVASGLHRLKDRTFWLQWLSTDDDMSIGEQPEMASSDKYEMSKPELRPVSGIHRVPMRIGDMNEEFAWRRLDLERLPIENAWKPNNVANWYRMFPIPGKTPVANYIDDAIAYKAGPVANWFENFNVWQETPALNALPVINIWKLSPKVNWFENINAWQESPTANWYENIMSTPKEKNTNWFENINMTPEEKVTNWFENFLMTPEIKNANWFENFLMTPEGKTVNWFENFLGYKPGLIANINPILLGSPQNKTAFTDTFYSVELTWGGTNIFGIDSCSTDRMKYGYYMDGWLPVNSDKNYYGFESNEIWADKEGKESYIQYYQLRGFKDRKYSRYDYYDIFPHGIPKPARYNYVQGLWSIRTMYEGKWDYEQGIHMGKRVKPAADIDYEFEWFQLSHRPTMLSKKLEWFVFAPRFTQLATTGPMYVHRVSYKLAYPFDEYKYWGHRTSYSLNDIKKERNEWGYKIPYSINDVKKERDEWLYRIPYDMDRMPNFIPSWKKVKPLNRTVSGTHLHRLPYALSRFYTGERLYKIPYDLCKTDYGVRLIKQRLPFEIFQGLTDDKYGAIIPVYKTPYSMDFIDKVDDMLLKIPKDLGLIDTTEEWLFKIPKDLMINEQGTFAHKEAFDVYIQYKNYRAMKSKLHAIMNKPGTFAYKSRKLLQIQYRNIWTSKARKRVWIEYSNGYHDIFGSKKPYEATITKGVWGNILPKHVLIDYYDIWALQIPKEAWYSYEVAFADKPPNICYYNYGFDMTIKERGNAFDTPDLWDVITEEKFLLITNMDAVNQPIKQGWIEDILLPHGFIHETEYFHSYDHVQRLYREATYFDDKNWVWVYETPNPFDPTYGIDELLLQETDMNYEDFVDLIFDKDNIVPKNPIKQISNTKFIAKLPTKHPFPERGDIGNVYEDSAVKWDNYYGIETEIMYKIYMQFFRIWQSRVFEFGGMDMVAATKKMLELIYAWIIVEFPVEKLQQAFRVYRQIRWYAEAAVLNNSQYVVEYELDELKSDLYTGACLIPNDLGFNNSMYVDSGLAVIRNNPATIGVSDAYVTFYIDCYKDTTITFSLSNTVGSVKIYLNGVQVGVHGSSVLNAMYDIPYTGTTNEFVIKKEASHNLNKNFYIGNIKVDNLSFKDLKVTFDPTLRQGNKPINEIMMKMLQYASLYDDIQEAYYQVRRSNLGINEMYRKMLDYWNLHHQNKGKGKRLTIKEE